LSGYNIGITDGIYEVHHWDGLRWHDIPHIFFSEYIYSKWLKFCDNINECFFYTNYFSTQSPSSCTALCQCGTSACIPCWYQLLSCLHSHFLTASITLLSSSKRVPRKASLRDPKRWKSDGARSGL
jgi:hypothetical protein